MSQRPAEPSADVAAALSQVAVALSALQLGPPAATAGATAPLFVVNHYHLNVNLGGAPAAAAPTDEPGAEEAPAAANAADAAGFQTPRGPGDPPGEEPAAEPAAATERCSADDAEDAAGRRDGESWAYAVWVHLLRPALRGVHCGGGAAWAALPPTLPGGRYAYASGTRLRRYESESAARAAYHAEAAAHDAPLSPHIWRHPLPNPL